MFHIFKPGTNYDIIGKAPLWIRISVATFVAGVLLLLVKGANFGLDFTGGHEILLEVAPTVKAEDVRNQVGKLNLGETAVQSFDEKANPNKAYYLVRVQRSETFGQGEIAALEGAFKQKYGAYLQRLRYNPEAGDVVEVELTATATAAAGVDTSTGAIAAVVAGTNHGVRQVRPIGRGDAPRYSVVLRGVDVSVVKAMQSLDPAAAAVKVDFVGPTVGAQLRNDGILAMLYALGLILLYVAFRFDIYFAPGAVICLFHDAVITIALMSAIGEEFSMTTIAAVLTLVGYSINDTIIVFDRIRETLGKAQGAAMKDIVNRATNETLSRTVMTSATTLISCLCLMIFGRGTVLYQFGLIMFCGVIFGTYSSIYVAAPIFIYLRERFGPKEVTPSKVALSKGMKKGPREASSSI